MFTDSLKSSVFFRIFNIISKVWYVFESALKIMDTRSVSSNSSHNSNRKAQCSITLQRKDSIFFTLFSFKMCNYPCKCKILFLFFETNTCYNLFHVVAKYLESRTWVCISYEILRRIIIQAFLLLWSNLFWSSSTIVGWVSLPVTISHNSSNSKIIWIFAL